MQRYADADFLREQYDRRSASWQAGTMDPSDPMPAREIRASNPSPSDDEKQAAALERLGVAYIALEASIEPFRRALGGGDPVTGPEMDARASAAAELEAAYAAYAALLYPESKTKPID